MAELLPLDTTLQKGFDRDVRSEPKGENRGNATLVTERDSQPISITLLKIDTAILTYLREKIKPVVIDNGKQIIVPIIYSNAERWKQIRKDGVVRDDKNQRIQLPVMLFRRVSIARSPFTSPVNRYLDRTYVTGWNRQTSYDKFAVQNGIVPSRSTVSVKVPDYISIAYDCMVWTDYIEQMNDVIEQINFHTDEYWGDRNNFKFKVTISDYKTDTDLGAVGDRYVKSAFQMEVRAYLLPETHFDTDKGVQATNQKRFTAKKVITIIEVDGTSDAPKGV